MKQFIIENAQWIFSGVGVALIIGAVRLILNWRKKNNNLTANHVSSQNITAGPGSTNVQTGKESTVLITTNHPTVKVPSQHISPIQIDGDGCVIHKAQISEGDFQEFIWGATTVKISISQILKTNFSPWQLGIQMEAFGAEIMFSTGGGLVYGGAYCKKTGVNKYIMPQKELQDEEPSSVYSYHIDEGYFRFIRAFVDHINPHSRQVTLNLFFAKVSDVKTS